MEHSVRVANAIVPFSFSVGEENAQSGWLTKVNTKSVAVAIIVLS